VTVDQPEPIRSQDPPHEPPEIPLGQRVCERPFLLLVVGILIMAVFYTGWGLVEIASLTQAPLP
jgi:hypothetical protein